MCGIAGILGIDEERSREIAPRMQAAMRHRGPDDQGTVRVPDPQHSAPPAVLIHTRLAIIDLTGDAHQPMSDRVGDAQTSANHLIFNGEIFNFQELHEELSRGGWPCRTRSDTEVILHGYRVWDERCVQRFRGMFAWCLLDSSRGTAWLCRDRLGIKPLYLYRLRDGGLLFASELRTLLAAGDQLVPPQISRPALESFLAQGAVFGQQSIVRGIEMLGAGESLWTDWSGKEIRRTKYWSIPSQVYDPCLPRPRYVAEISRRLRDAVRLRLIADVPLGLFLSGGIDSAAIATIATEVGGADVQSICIGFDQADFDESAAAAAVARQLGTQHRSLHLNGEEVLHDLPEVLAAIDQPTVDGFNTYFVSRAARRAGLTVALSGLGGDELFGGYASFRDVPRAAAWARALRAGGPLRSLLTRSLRRQHRRGMAKTAEMLRRGASMVQLYLLRRELFLPEERRAMQDLPDGSDELCGLPLEMVEQLKCDSSGFDPINQISRLELRSYMHHMLLRDADAFSMAHALEIRVPLLDHELLELAARAPGRWKRADPRPKPLLVDAAGSRLPRAVYQSPKRGFTFPWERWLRGPLKSRAAEAAENRDVWRSLRLNPDAPAMLWNRFIEGDGRISALQILAIVVLEDFVLRHQLVSEA